RPLMKSPWSVTPLMGHRPQLLAWGARDRSRTRAAEAKSQRNEGARRRLVTQSMCDALVMATPVMPVMPTAAHLLRLRAHPGRPERHVRRHALARLGVELRHRGL